MDEQQVLEQALQRQLTAAHGSDAPAAKTLLAYVGLTALQQQQRGDSDLLALQKMAADMLEAEAVRKVQARFEARKRRAGSALACKVTEVRPAAVAPPCPAPEQFHANSVFA